MVKGMLAKCVQDTTSRLLGEGEHTIESTDFQVVDFEDITKIHCIQHGKLSPLSFVWLIAMSYYILIYILAVACRNNHDSSSHQRKGSISLER